MAADLGATLSGSAMEPLLTSYAHLSGGKVGDGLDAIAPERLLHCFRQGVEQTARRAGVAPARVERLLPWSEVEVAIEQIRVSQHAALEVWRQHAGQLGGFLTGVAEVTAESERPDVGWFLARLAGKVIRDRRLSAPLDELSADITRWEQLVQRCAGVVDAGGDLRSAYFWRWARAGIVLLLLAGATGAAALLVVRQRAARARVTAALAGAPCDAEGIAAADLERASAEQRSLREERVKACEASRARAAYEAGCLELAGRVEAGRITPEDEAAATRPPKILGRIARGALETADLHAEELELPCKDTPAAARLEATFARAAGDSWAAWAETDRISARLLARHAAGRLLLTDASRQALSEHAESVAKRGVLQGEAGSIEQGKTLCALERTLGAPAGKWCTALGVALSRSAPR